MRTKNILIILCCSHLIFGFIVQENKSDSNSIEWSEVRKLTWDDFQGNPDTLRYKGFKAVTWTELKGKSKIFTDKIEYYLTCSFLKKDSWHLSDSKPLLRHEQGHFDIAEIFAREFRKTLSRHISKNMSETKKFIDSVKINLDKGKDRLTDVYEKETNYSRNTESQLKWDTKIKQMLEETKAYTNTKVIIKRITKK